MIDVSKIDEFRLHRNEMSLIEPDERYSFSFVDNTSFKNNKDSLVKVIKFLHEDLVWDGIPTIEQVKQRLDFGSICMLWKFENKVVGWSWLNNRVISFDWSSKHKELFPDEQYGGGAFLHRASSPEPKAGYKFYRFGIENMFKSYNKSVLYLYSDSWNRASSILSYRVGFKKYNFI